ncbi:hypothetical protein GCM10010219_62320 [Streptomyces netropsis]|nr:hypothetical protein GCM10010219_62320 [Streptomyces netropsis]
MTMDATTMIHRLARDRWRRPWGGWWPEGEYVIRVAPHGSAAPEGAHDNLMCPRGWPIRAAAFPIHAVKNSTGIQTNPNRSTVVQTAVPARACRRLAGAASMPQVRGASVG